MNWASLPQRRDFPLPGDDVKYDSDRRRSPVWNRSNRVSMPSDKRCWWCRSPAPHRLGAVQTRPLTPVVPLACAQRVRQRARRHAPAPRRCTHVHRDGKGTRTPWQRAARRFRGAMPSKRPDNRTCPHRRAPREQPPDATRGEKASVVRPPSDKGAPGGERYSVLAGASCGENSAQTARAQRQTTAAQSME